MCVSIELTSCDKESLTKTIDNIPEVEVKEIVVENTNSPLPSLSAIVDNNEVALAIFIFDNTVNNYSLVLPSSMIDAPGAIFESTWVPATPETTLQATTYIIDHVATISQEGLDAYNMWVLDGSDPETMPDLFSPDSPYRTEYISSLTYTISNITDTTAEVELSGEIEDPDGFISTVSESLTADLYQ